MKKNYLRIISVILAAIILTAATTIVNAQQRRALLIGINTYAPNEEAAMAKGSDWKNLKGTLNDVEAIESILEKYYMFDEENISVLIEAKATRDGIMNGITNLMNVSSKGDIAFIYYSGHGAQVRNSLAPDPQDQQTDEAIVPYDAIDGAKYIRDKEIGKIFNQMLDKGILLTAVFDCCHSGSITKGFPSAEPDLSKKLPMDTVDVKDPARIDEPYKRGALILSASQDNEVAKETINGEDTTRHGAFTKAFIRALRESGEGASASEVFTRTEAYIKYLGMEQIPDIACTPERGDMTLFGETASAKEGRVLIAVKQIDKYNGTISLNGGRALGFIEGSQFRMTRNPEIIVEVITLEGVATSIAKPIKGKLTEIQPADLFELINWGIPARPNLYVYAPPADLSYDALLKHANNLMAFCAGKKIKWVIDPLSEAVTHYILYTNEGWILMDKNGNKIKLGKEMNEQSLAKFFTSENSSLYFEVPPFAQMFDGVKLGKYTVNNMVEYSNDNIADYKLAGRWKDNSFEYCWALKNVSSKNGFYSGTLPINTGWHLATNTPAGISEIGENLTTAAMQLGKIRFWLNLPSPHQDDPFPYKLGLKNTTTGEIIESGAVKGGEFYLSVLIKDKNDLTWNGNKRWVYVFSLDIEGKIGLLFPTGSNVENLLPYDAQVQNEIIELGNRRFEIWPPFGNDTYFLLTSDEEIRYPQDVFNTEPFPQTKGGEGNLTPLERFFKDINLSIRGTSPPAPAPKEWSIQRINILSVGQ